MGFLDDFADAFRAAHPIRTIERAVKDLFGSKPEPPPPIELESQEFMDELHGERPSPQNPR
ncbi:MAG TPA: hypothetical protein VFM96_01485 [Gaiellaceae bacterium]|nr:hypothetical protein [Gaiellaceae bacterium]